MRKSYLIPIIILLTITLSFCLFNQELVFAENKVLYLGGNLIGINLDVEGVYITSKISIITKTGIISPFGDADILMGDILYSIDNSIIHSPSDIENIIKDKKQVQVRIKRNNNYVDYTIKPLIDLISRKCKLGLLIKDNITGVGTISYVNPENNSYAALGHPVKDYQNNDIINAQGEIYLANVINVIKPKENYAGQLNAIFDQKNGAIGNIKTTLKTGIYGNLFNNELSKIKVEIGNKNQVKATRAKIRSTVLKSNPEYYDINIISINSNDKQKNILFEVVDEKLLGITGGIVQGMSGSPIIQDGKIIGAVTHVFVNNPTQGYGIFIEEMLSK